MNARYWQRGETLDYTAEEAVVNGQVVSLGNRIGVAGNDIAEGATGALHVTGVYIMDKKASEKQTTFVVGFRYLNGRLHVSEFKETSDQDPFGAGNGTGAAPR